MFPHHPQSKPPNRVCLVGGTASSLSAAANRYLAQGDAVDILEVDEGDWCLADRAKLIERGVSITALASLEIPGNDRVPNLHPSAAVERADQVRRVLERLDRDQPFAVIEFALRSGLGFRTLQAKRAGLGFDAARLLVRLDACSAWEREQAERWPQDYAEVEHDYLERYCYEHADGCITPDAELLQLVNELGWRKPVAVTGPKLDEAALPTVTLGIAYYNLGKYLPMTLASLAEQTYPNLEIIVIDDGSTDPESIRVFEAMQSRYPGYRFLRQGNAGIGVTRNSCLAETHGQYFIPMDADNLARPEMVAAFVTAIRRNPEAAAMTCYFLAFEDTPEPVPTKFLHAGRPTGGPHVLASIRNVYGDACAIFRTDVLREVGGYGIDRGTSCEDWELFVKLIHAGQSIGVVPEHLFYYRHLPGGFSRKTNRYRNHLRPLRQFTQQTPVLPAGESVVLWTALLGFHQRILELEERSQLLRYRLADALFAAVRRLPGVAGLMKKAILGVMRIGRLFRQPGRSRETLPAHSVVATPRATAVG